MSKARYLTVNEFAKELRAQARSVRRWCEKGYLQAFQTPGGRGWRILVTELDRIRRGEPMPTNVAQASTG